MNQEVAYALADCVGRAQASVRNQGAHAGFQPTEFCHYTEEPRPSDLGRGWPSECMCTLCTLWALDWVCYVSGHG